LPDEVHSTDPTEVADPAPPGDVDATASPQEAAISSLRARAEAGDASAAFALADALAEHGRLDDAVAVLREQADVGNAAAAERLVEVLIEHQGSDQAIDFLRGRADAGDESAAELLTGLLALQSFVDDEAVNLLRVRADAGDKHATDMLPRLLVERRRLDDAVSFLRSRVDAGDERAAELLAILLAELNAMEEASTTPQQPRSALPTPLGSTTHDPSTSYQRDEATEGSDRLPRSGEETVRPVQGRSGTALLIVAPDRVARVTRSAVLHRQGSTTVTVAYFDSDGRRFPLQELDQIERVEHRGLLGPRLFELWALFRGHRVRLFHTYDAREFGQVTRALVRAREYAGVA
jgi:TPR repeat protein